MAVLQPAALLCPLSAGVQERLVPLAAAVAGLPLGPAANRVSPGSRRGRIHCRPEEPERCCWTSSYSFCAVLCSAGVSASLPLLSADGGRKKKQYRKRIITQPPANGGQDCPESLSQERECEVPPVCQGYR